MGRIKTKQVKSLGQEFVRGNPTMFSTEFDQNKQILNKTGMKSKWLRNRLAGYIAKLQKQKARGLVVSAPQKVEEKQEE